MFGSPPFRILADHLAQDEGFLTDARRVIALEAVQFEELARTLEEFDSFIDRDLLKQKVAEVLGPTEESKEIASTIWQLASMLREADEPFEKTVSILRSTFTEKMTELETDERQLLVDRIERLAAKPAGFNKQHKAQQLAEATGRELDEIQIICDIRPVFNDDRTLIEGGIPVATGMKNVRFRRMIKPGDTIEMDVRLTDRISKAWFLSARVTCGGQLAVRLEFTCAIAPTEV